MNAAMMISRIMPLTRAVETKQVRITSQVSLPACQTKNSAAITPSAALSVAVAMPKYRLPITMPNTTSGGDQVTQRAHPLGHRHHAARAWRCRSSGWTRRCTA